MVVYRFTVWEARLDNFQRHLSHREQTKTVRLVWECSLRVHLREWNGILQVHHGKDASSRLNSKRFCMSWEVSCSSSPTLEECVWVALFSCDDVFFFLLHCSGLSNTESGRTEIFSFFSGQLYSFGSFVCINREDTGFKSGQQKIN